MLEFNQNRVSDERRRTFESKMANRMKILTSDGIFPGSPLFMLSKVNMIIEIAQELKMNISFDMDDENIVKALKMRRFKPFRNYKFNLFLTRMYYLKDYLKPWTRVNDFIIWCWPSKKMIDIIRDYQIISKRKDVWEPETTKIVNENVLPGMVCVDVGASIGYFTLLFSRLVGRTGKVVSIEPTDFQQPYRKMNVYLNGFADRVHLVEAGAWDKDEIIKMPRNAPPYVQTELRCRPIDDILEELGINKIDFIKIDVDGPEPNVLKGLIRTIERSPDMKMVVEYYPKYILDAGLNPEEMLEILNKYFTYEVIPGDYTDGCWNYFCTRKNEV